MKRKILIIMGRYLPGYKDGGPVRSIKNLVDRLGEEYDFHILTADRDHGDKESYQVNHPELKAGQWNQIGNAKVYYVVPGGFTEEIVGQLATDVDMIYMCGCFNDYARTTMKLKRKGKISCKVVIASMGLFSPGAFHIKYAKKKTYVIVLRILGYFRDVEWSATDEAEVRDIKREMGKKAICHLAEDLPRFAVPVTHNAISEKGELRVIFLSRISQKKNLSYAIKILQQWGERYKGKICFDIFGNKEDMAYWESCEAQLNKLPKKICWEYKGEADSEQVPFIFSKYDIFLFPTMAENYGHVIFEALMGGCIPLISDKTPWDEHKMENIGRSLPLVEGQEGLDKFVEELHEFVMMEKKQLQEKADACIDFARKYHAEKAENQYREIFNS